MQEEERERAAATAAEKALWVVGFIWVCVCSLFLDAAVAEALVVAAAVAACCALTFAHGAHASTRFSHCPACCCVVVAAVSD